MANNVYDICVKNEMSQDEFNVEFEERGYGVVTPRINGVLHPEMAMGYVSEKDREAGMKCLKFALEAAHGNTYKAMSYIMGAMRELSAKEEPPKDECCKKECCCNHNKKYIMIETDNYSEDEYYLVNQHIIEDAYGNELIDLYDDPNFSENLPEYVIKIIAEERLARYLED